MCVLRGRHETELYARLAPKSTGCSLAKVFLGRNGSENRDYGCRWLGFPEPWPQKSIGTPTLSQLNPREKLRENAYGLRIPALVCL